MPLNPRRHVVLLTAGRRYGSLVLAEFARRGIVLPTLVVYAQPAIRWWTMGRLRHLATNPIAPLYFLRAAWRRAGIRRSPRLGCTAYWVAAGTDTGRVITRRLLRVTEAEKSLKDVETANDRLAAEMTADLVTSAMAGETLPPGIAQSERFPVCRWLPLKERPRVDDLVAGGTALALFEAWRVRCADERLDLPMDMVPPIGEQ